MFCLIVIILYTLTIINHLPSKWPKISFLTLQFLLILNHSLLFYIICAYRWNVVAGEHGGRDVIVQGLKSFRTFLKTLIIYKPKTSHLLRSHFPLRCNFADHHHMKIFFPLKLLLVVQKIVNQMALNLDYKMGVTRLDRSSIKHGHFLSQQHTVVRIVQSVLAWCISPSASHFPFLCFCSLILCSLSQRQLEPFQTHHIYSLCLL